MKNLMHTVVMIIGHSESFKVLKDSGFIMTSLHARSCDDVVYTKPCLNRGCFRNASNSAVF